MELRHGSRRREHHPSLWARSTHELLACVTSLDCGVPETLVAGDVLAHVARRTALMGVEDLRSGVTALAQE